MEDIVKIYPGFKPTTAPWAHEAATEIESLRAQLANEKRAATEIYQALENSRAQLAEAKKELEEANETASNNFAAVQEIDLWLIQHDMLKITHEGGGEAAGLNVVDALENMHQQLLATQAHAARMKEALETCKARTIMGGGPMCEVSFYFDEAKVQKALSTPNNLAALHETLARECERLAHLFPRGSMHAHKMLEEAAYHMAKKDNHQ